MEYKKENMEFPSIRTGIFLELSGVTIWKISSYFSQDTVGCAYMILIFVITGYYMFRTGGARLMNAVYKGFEWDDGFSKCSIIIIGVIFFLFASLLMYLLPQDFDLPDIIHKLGRPIGRVNGMVAFFTLIFICVDVAVYGLIGVFIKCIQELGGPKTIWPQFIWLLCIAGFTYILTFFTGDSKSTLSENAIISVIFLGAHWYMGRSLIKALDQPECADRQQEGGRRLQEIPPKRRIIGISLMGVLVLAGVLSIARSSSERDFICYPHSGGVILGEYTGDRSRIRIPERIDGKKVLGLNRSFAYNRTVRSVKLPEGLKILGDHTFSGCSRLSSITVPGSLEYIGQGCFGSSNLTTFNQGNAEIQMVGIGAFSQTPWYWSHVKNHDTILIGGNLIYYKALGETVHMPEGARVILQGALVDNDGGALNVHELYLPESLEILGDKAFIDFYYLTDLHIPESVRYISLRALEQPTAVERDKPQNLVIWGRKGSEAEKIAKERGLLFLEEGSPEPPSAGGDSGN